MLDLSGTHAISFLELMPVRFSIKNLVFYGENFNSLPNILSDYIRLW